MSKEILHSSAVDPCGEEPWIDRIWQRLICGPSQTKLAAAAFLITIAVMFMYRPLSQAEVGDSATYDYMAQCVLRGEVPYRDVIDNKAPGSFYLSALAMKAGKLIGLRDLIAARMLHILLAGLLSVLIFLVSEVYLRDRLAAVIAFLLPLMSPRFAEWVVGSGQPKLPMILFGILTLLLVARDRPFWAGVCSMLSCLCWQPGLLFTGTAFLIFSRYLTSWRDLRAIKVLAGASIPLLILLLYFYSKGALDDLWTWTVTFNYGIYGPRSIRNVDQGAGHLWNVTLKIFRFDIVLVALSLAGLVVFAAQRLSERIKSSRALVVPDLFRDAIIIAPVAYLAFSFVKFNGGPYLIPLFPFIGIFAGFGVVICERLIMRTEFLEPSAARRALASWLPKLLPAIMLLVVFFRGAMYQFKYHFTLQYQDRAFEVIPRVLGPDDCMYVHGTAELLVLLNRPNLNPYIYLDWGKDDLIATRKEGGFSDVIAEIESRAPKVVAISRLQRVAHRAEFREWVEKHYEPLEVPGYDGIYLRKQQGPETSQ